MQGPRCRTRRAALQHPGQPARATARAALLHRLLALALRSRLPLRQMQVQPGAQRQQHVPAAILGPCSSKLFLNRGQRPCTVIDMALVPAAAPYAALRPEGRAAAGQPQQPPAAAPLQQGPQWTAPGQGQQAGSDVATAFPSQAASLAAAGARPEVRCRSMAAACSPWPLAAHCNRVHVPHVRLSRHSGQMQHRMQGDPSTQAVLLDLVQAAIEEHDTRPCTEGQPAAEAACSCALTAGELVLPC